MEEILRSSNLRLIKRVTGGHSQKVNQKAVNCECGVSYQPGEEAIQWVTQEGNSLEAADLNPDLSGQWEQLQKSGNHKEEQQQAG